MCYARGIAIITFDWIRKYCTITGPNNHTINDLPSIYVCRLLKALLHYKSSAMEKQLAGAPHCDTITLRKQIENAVQCDKHLSLLWDKEKDDALEDSLIFQSDGYSVTWSACSAWVSFTFPWTTCWLSSDPDKEIHKMGTTSFDKKWRSGEEYRLLRRPLKRLKN